MMKVFASIGVALCTSNFYRSAFVRLLRRRKRRNESSDPLIRTSKVAYKMCGQEHRKEGLRGKSRIEVRKGAARLMLH